MKTTQNYRITWLGTMSGFRLTANYKNLTEKQLNKLIADKLEKNIKPIRIKRTQPKAAN